MSDRILAFAEAHPETFGLVCTIVLVPLLGSAASFLDAWAAKRWPVGVALLRALLPDIKRFVAILVTKAFESRKLPVPPEVRQLTVERVEKAIEATSSKPPPRIPPGITSALLALVVCVIVASLAGCSRAEQVRAANGERTAGHATAHTLGADDEEKRSPFALCDYEALDAQTALANAHAAQVHAIEAARRGKCLTTTPRSEPACDLDGMARHTFEAGVALSRAIARVQAAVEGGTAK